MGYTASPSQSNKSMIVSATVGGDQEYRRLNIPSWAIILVLGQYQVNRPLLHLR